MAALRLSWRCCINGCLLFLLLLLFPSFSMQQETDHLGNIYLQCLRNTTTSTALSSSFTSNLNTALRNFTNLSSQGFKYAITTVPRSLGQDTVYAAFQCRGDLSGQSCGECVQNVTARLPEECPDAVGARIRVDGCSLRYDNEAFFELNTTYVLGFCSTSSTSNATTLQSIADIMEKVTSEAPKQGGFASASAGGFFAAAQCVGYLNESDCSQCLLNLPYGRVCGNSTLGQQVYLASCDYRYETYNFLDTPAMSPSPSPVAPRLSPAPSVPGGRDSPLLPPPSSPAGGAKASISPISLLLVILVSIIATAPQLQLLWF